MILFSLPAIIHNRYTASVLISIIGPVWVFVKGLVIALYPINKKKNYFLLEHCLLSMTTDKINTYHQNIVNIEYQTLKWTLIKTL